MIRDQKNTKNEIIIPITTKVPYSNFQQDGVDNKHYLSSLKQYKEEI